MLTRTITNLSVTLSVVAALVGLWHYRRLRPPLRLVALLACFDAAAELISVVLVSRAIPNLFLLPTILAGEALLLTLAYQRALASPQLRRVLLGVLGMFLAFLASQAWLKLGLVQYFAVAQVVNNLYMLGLAGLYYRQLLHELHVARLSRDPLFWLSTGLIIYALGNMLIVLSSDYVLTHYSLPVQRLVLMAVRNLFNIILYLAYIVALWMRPPKPNF